MPRPTLSTYEFLVAQQAKEEMEFLNPLSVAVQLEKARGNVQRCAKNMGVNSYEIRQLINADPQLKQVYEEIRESQLDETEDRLMSAIRRGDEGSIRFMLRTRGANRGYGERLEYQGNVNQNVTGQIEHTIDSDTAETIFSILEAAGAISPPADGAEDESLYSPQADA